MTIHSRLAMEESDTNSAVGKGYIDKHFSLVTGGPFCQILDRIGLNGPDRIPHARAGIVLALFAWTPPAILAVIQTLVDSQYSGWDYFRDLTVYTRYLIAIGVMVATERYADRRITHMLEQFGKAEIVSPSVKPQFLALLERADQKSASSIAEFVMLLITVTWSVYITDVTIELSAKSWEGSLSGGMEILSWAGIATTYLSTPLFLFLVLRWLWRFLIWTLLLYRISRLSLQLTPLHPDKAGGLGFLSIYPSVFGGFVFAMSCVVASSFLKELGLATHDSTTVWLAITVWMVMIIGLFLGPLLTFSRPLYDLRHQALLDYGLLASEHHLLFHREWIENKKSGADLLGSAIPSSISDLNASCQAVQDMQTSPLDMASFMQLLLASGLPMLAVVLKLMPLGELISLILGSIL